MADTPKSACRCTRNGQRRLQSADPGAGRTLSGAGQNAELMLPGQMGVESIESFVATNIEELSLFLKKKVVSGLRGLLEIYNRRVSDCETDKSLLIEIPRNI